MTTRRVSWLIDLGRERSVWIAVVLWAACSLAVFPLSHGTLPFNRPMMAAAVLAVGRIVGLRLFGEGIGLHLNGSLFGPTRLQTPHEVWFWAAVAIIFVVLTFMGPGLIRSYLTVRTGNAWVHLWAYHAIAPHVTLDTPTLVRIFGIRRA
jgi:hypothetical protein